MKIRSANRKERKRKTANKVSEAYQTELRLCSAVKDGTGVCKCWAQGMMGPRPESESESGGEGGLQATRQVEKFTVSKLRLIFKS